jgi:LysR family transcriptional regulator for bpeEF and oprC
MLTPEGEALFDRAVQLLADIEETRDLFAPAGRAPQGSLRVDVPVSLARSLIIPRLTEFTARYPGIELVLGVSDLDMDLVAEGVVRLEAR